MGVFKCLVKMAIAIMPEIEVNNFSETIAWILEKSTSKKLLDTLQWLLFILLCLAQAHTQGLSFFSYEEKTTN